MKLRSYFNTATTICLWVIFGFINLAAFRAHAETVYYILDNVMLDDGTQMTGIISWPYMTGDFENGTPQFVSLTIPHSSHNQDDLIATIEVAQIEITFDGNAHDDGVDIKLVLQQPLTPTTSSLIDTNTAASKYSIGGNSFYDGFFVSGSITLTNLTLSITPDSPGFALLSWGPEIPGFVLQETPSLSTNWMDSSSGSTNPVVVPVTAPAMFYRLANP